MPTRDELRAAIARAQALIERLEREREEAQARVRSLHAVLDGPAEGAERTSLRASPPATAAEKVAVFRGLFRGPDDVFAKLWVNPRTDRQGYAHQAENVNTAPSSIVAPRIAGRELETGTT